MKKQTVTIHYIKGAEGDSYRTENNPFENYEIYHTERSSQPIDFICENAADFVVETFTLDEDERKVHGWLRIDDEWGECEATEHTVLIPVREMTDTEAEDWADEMAQRDLDDLIDGAPSYQIQQRIRNRADIHFDEYRESYL